jgi:hypothetical protein
LFVVFHDEEFGVATSDFGFWAGAAECLEEEKEWRVVLAVPEVRGLIGTEGSFASDESEHFFP